MRLAVIENGKCINIIKADESFIIPGKELVPFEDGYGIDDLYSEGIWSIDPVKIEKDAEREAARLEKLQLKADYKALKELMKDKAPKLDEVLVRLEFVEKILKDMIW